MKILNLTMHPASPEQVSEGVVEPSDKNGVKALLDFTELPSDAIITLRASRLASIAYAEDADAAMIGGAPYLMGPLERELKRLKVQPLYAFSVRESVEKVVDGATVKTNIFRHVGFVKA